MENKEIKYFAYVRKSTEGEERQALSIESQIDKIREYFSNIHIVEILEERHSAFEPYNRPVFASMIDRIRRGEAQGILSWHPDRLSRNEIDAGNITYMIRKNEIKDLKFGSYNFDNSPEGIWMLQMALSQSQYFSAKLSKDVKRGLEKKLKMGWRPGVPPEGYINDKKGLKGEKEIIRDPERYDLVRKMWDLMLTGAYTPPRILEIANNQWGYRTMKRRKSGGGPLSRSGIYSLFTNPFYAGIINYSGKTCPGIHEAMITLEEFDKVQILLGRKGKPRPQKHHFAYTAMIRCEECGCFYTAQTKKKLIKSTGEIREYTFYHCTKKKLDITCSQRKNIRVENLEAQIEKIISSISIIPDFRTWALEVLNSSNDKEIADRSKIHETQSNTLLAVQNELDNLTKMRYRDLITDEEYMKERNELQLKIGRLKEELRDIEARAEKWLELTEEVFDFATYAHSKFLKGSLDEKKEILIDLGSNFLMKGGKLKLDLKKWFVPIEKAYPELEKEYRELEPYKDRLNIEQIAQLDSICSRWRRREDSNLRRDFALASLAVRCFRPLSHVSSL